MSIKQFPFFRFYLDGQEVFPKGDWSFEYTLIDNNAFFYRLELNGSIILKNDDANGRTDYDIVKALEGNTVASLEVKRYCSGTYSTYWSGFLDLLVEWDTRGTYTGKAVPDDEYTILSEQFDKEYNIYSLGLTKRTVTDTVEFIGYDNGIFLSEIIEYILDDLEARTYLSDFFDSATNPVTGISNQLNELVLYRKIDVIDITVNSVKGIVTMNKILKWCRVMFNCFPSIDSSSRFRIENMQYYHNANSYSVERTIGEDLTSLESGRFIENMNVYNYDDSKLFRKEIYSYVDTENLEFIGTQIEYDINQTKKNTSLNDLGDMSTDIKFLQDKPDEANNNGFSLMSIVNTAGTLTLRYLSLAYQMQAKQLRLGESDYDTFTKIGTDNITSAIKDSSGGQILINGEILRDIQIGDQFILSGNFTLNSGELPDVSIYDQALLISDVQSLANPASPSPNQNNIAITIDIAADIGRLEIRNPLGATNWKMLDITLRRNPRQNVPNGHLSWLHLLNTYFQYGRPLLEGNIYGIDRFFDSTSKAKSGKAIPGIGKCCSSFDVEKLVTTDIGNGLNKKVKITKDGMIEYELIYD